MVRTISYTSEALSFGNFDRIPTLCKDQGKQVKDRSTALNFVPENPKGGYQTSVRVNDHRLVSNRLDIVCNAWEHLYRGGVERPKEILLWNRAVSQ